MDKTLERIYAIRDQDLKEYEKHLMVGGGTPGPTLFKGKGIRVEDIDGRRYIDCTSQSWALYLGYGNEEITEIVTEHLKNLSHVHQGFNTLPRFYLAKKLADLAPGSLNRVSFTVGGGSAIEASMKIALKNRTKSTEFLCLFDAYHGTTLTTIGASWISTKASGNYTGAINFLPLLKTFIRVPNPYCYRCYFNLNPDNCDLMCAKFLRYTLERGVNGEAAGIIIEPLQASAGQIPCPQKYLKEVRKICDEFGVLLIYDEIQTFARIGEMFAAIYYDVIPDIIVLGKGLGGGLPMAAIIIRDGLEGFSPQAEELHTFANSSVAQVASIKLIEIIERDKLLDNAREIGGYITQAVGKMQKEFPEIGDVRGVGLHIGIEFIKDLRTKEPAVEMTAKIRHKAMKKGVIFGLGGARKNVLKIKPPLIVKKSEADEILSVFYDSIKEVLR